MANAPDLRSWMVKVRNAGLSLTRSTVYYVIASTKKSAIFQAKRLAGYNEEDAANGKHVLLAETLSNLE